MKLLVFCFSVLALTPVFAQAMSRSAVNYNCQSLPQPQNIEGQWLLGEATSNGVNFSLMLNIKTNSTIIRNVCSGFGQTTTAEFEVASSYTDSAYQVLASGHAENSAGNLNCNADVQPMTIQYSWMGGCLQAHDPASGQSLVLYPIQ